MLLPATRVNDPCVADRAGPGRAGVWPDPIRANKAPGVTQPIGNTSTSYVYKALPFFSPPLPTYTTTVKVTSMAAAAAMPVERVVFALNGRRYEVAGADPSTRLLEFIRTQTPFKGTKLGCGEALCSCWGLCMLRCSSVVQLSIRLLGQAIEGSNSRVWGGVVAAPTVMDLLIGVVVGQQGALARAMPNLVLVRMTATFMSLETSFVFPSFQCTGYRPIVDACKSFASDVDLEDLGLNIFWKRSDKNPDVSELPSYTIGGGVCTFPDFLKSEIKSSHDTLVLSKLRLAFGAYGTEHAIRAKKVEKFLTEPGKALTSGSADSADRDDVRNLPVSSRRETIPNDDYKPVGEPLKKYAVELQTSGEAVYVDDIPAPKNCLFGEFIYSTQALAFVKSIKFKSSLASEKIIDVVSAKDIPSGGENIGSTFTYGDEPLFGDPIAEYAGQALGVVIAETQRYADMAAKQVIIEYDTEDLGPPILTVEEAVEKSSYFEVPPDLYPKEVGDVSKGMSEADDRIPSTEVKLASEYYFYMETQTALAIPDEDNTMVVYSSSQYPELAQSVIARLKPVSDKLQQQSKNVSWDTLIAQAIKENINLSASAYSVPGQDSSKYLNYGAGISEVEIDLLTGAITLLRGDLVYDCGKSLNPAVDLGQIEGSFIQGIGFFIYEEYITNSDGLMISNSTWDYKIPSVDIIPKKFNAEILNTGYHKNRVLSSKASGEPAVVLASSVHCALREAIRAARKEFANSNGSGSSPLEFQMDVPAPMTLVKELCGFDIVEKYLRSLSTYERSAEE
nr:unnamed protein product [Digitaria exilis]